MLDIQTFGTKLKNHRKNMGLTQEEVASKMGVSPQAVSKWENGDCLPDCFNLKSLADIYGISLDILLETSDNDNIESVSARIEQIADEFIWAKQSRHTPHAHRDLGDDLWQMWKGIYFIEAGDKETQKRDKNDGNLRISSEYGMKIWDDDGIACVVKNTIKAHLEQVDEQTLSLLSELATPEGFRLICALDTNRSLSKAELIKQSGIEPSRLNELLLLFMENEIIEFVSERKKQGSEGYKINAYRGMAAYLMLCAAFVLNKSICSVSEYIKN